MTNTTTMYQQMICAILESVINKALLLSLNGTKSLSGLEQKCVVVHLSELGFPLSFIVTNNKMSDGRILVTSLDEHPDCAIHTSIKTLIELKKEQQLTELIKQDKLDIVGDIKIAQQFAQLAETLDIDWQTELAKYIGDIPTFKLTQFGKKLGEKLSFTAKQIEADSTEWLVHEKRLIVPRSEISSFNLQVSELDIRTESLTEKFAKINLLLSSSVNNTKDACE